MEKNYWQIDDNLYKVYISADVYNELEEQLNIDNPCKYMRKVEIFAYDFILDKDELKKVTKRLKEFDC